MPEPVEPSKKKRIRRKKDSVDYVNNKEFGEAVAEHVRGVKEDVASGVEPRPMTDYIGLCLYKISNGLSHSPNFVNYTYREDMVMDAVENCVKVVNNFDITKETRTGVPNAFSYFTQISYFCFLRRIAKEKRQMEIKQRLIDNTSINAFAEFGTDDITAIGQSIVERMRHRNGLWDEECWNDQEDAKPPPKKKKRGRPAKKAVINGPLNEFFKEEE
jgi:hypothetical protein